MDLTAPAGADPDSLTLAVQAAVPLTRTLGITVITTDPLQLRLPNDEPGRNHVGGPHAGAIFTLGETTAATAMLLNHGHLLDRGVALAVRSDIEWSRVARCAVLSLATVMGDPARVTQEFLAGGRPEWVTRLDFRREDDDVECGVMNVTLTLVHPRD